MISGYGENDSDIKAISLYDALSLYIQYRQISHIPNANCDGSLYTSLSLRRCAQMPRVEQPHFDDSGVVH